MLFLVTSCRVSVEASGRCRGLLSLPHDDGQFGVEDGVVVLIGQPHLHLHSSACSVESDLGNLGGSGENVAGSDGRREPYLVESEPGDHCPLVEHCLCEQPLSDGNGVYPAGDESAEVSLISGVLIDVKPLCVPEGCEVDQFGLGDGVIAQFEDLARG